MQSPQKKLLHLQQYTPSKITVGYQINGWFQTQQKIQQQIKNKSFKYIPPKPLSYGKNTISNFQALKKKIYRLNNLQQFSATKKKLQLIPKTQATQNFSQSISNQNSLQRYVLTKNQALIKISSFEDHLIDIKTGQRPNNNLLRLVQIKNQNQKFNQFNEHNTKIEQKSKRMTKILAYNKMKNNSQLISEKFKQNKIINPLMMKRQLVSQSVDIIKTKLSANQYKALNMVIRKTQNVQIKIPVSYQKIKIMH